MPIDPSKIIWDSTPPAPAPAGLRPLGPAPQRLPSPQTPAQASQDQSSAEYKGYQVRSQPVYDRANALDKVRDGYRQDKRVLKYEEAEPVYISALQSPGNPAGDTLLVNAFSKVLDPSTGVQAREAAAAEGAQPAYDQLKASLLKQFGTDGYGNFTPEGRAKMREALTVRMRLIADQYRSARADHGNYIKKLGIPDTEADTIMGPFAGEPFRKAEADYLGREPALNVPLNQQSPQGPASDEEVAAFVKANRNLNPDQLRIMAKAQLGRDIDNAEELLKAYGQGAAFNDQVIDPTANAFMNGVGDVVEGVAAVPGLIANPLNAGINWATGSHLGTDFGQSARDALGLPDNGNPYSSAINKGGAGAMTGAGIAGLMRPIVSGPVASAVTNSVAAQPARQVVAGGSAGGSSEAARQRGFGPGGQFVAGVLGGAAGYGGASGLADAASRVTSGPSQLAQAAERQRVQLMPGDVGGPVAKRVTGAAAQAPFSASPIIAGATKAQKQIGAATRRAADRAGDVIPIDEAGDAVQKAALEYAPKQAQRIGKVYDRAEERAKGVKIKPLQAAALLDEQIARLSQTGSMGAPLVKDLQSIRQSIANGVSVSGMRDVRTLLSQGTFNGKIRSSMEKGIYKQVIKAVSSDIENGLKAAGRKDALNLFRVADKAWEQRIDHIDRVLEPVVGGGKSGEQVLEAVESMARGKSGGVKRLSGLLAELPQEEAANVRATVVDRLGKATAGQQDNNGGKFSAASFLTRWNNMSDKGKAALFGGGSLRRNLDEIASLANATEQTGKYANTSNTVGGIVSNAGILASVAYSSPKAALIGAVTQFMTGRLMASPRFTSWLAKAPQSEAAMPMYREKLGQIAAQEPIIANDIQSIQNFLRGGLDRAAASPEEKRKDR